MSVKPGTTPPACRRRRCDQAGLGLIEVLLAILVLAIGLLGFAGLQTRAITLNYDSLQRARASILAEELFDRLRANRNHALTTNDYERDFADPLPGSATSKVCTFAEPASGTTSSFDLTQVCSPAEMAVWDMRDWLQRMQDRAPGATAAVIRSTGSSYLVTIRLVEVAAAEGLGQGATDAQVDAASRVAFQFETAI